MDFLNSAHCSSVSWGFGLGHGAHDLNGVVAYLSARLSFSSLSRSCSPVVVTSRSAIRIVALSDLD